MRGREASSSRRHTQEREDWIVLLVFNHLLAGAEAFVSANLYDFPATLKARRAARRRDGPRGRGPDSVNRRPIGVFDSGIGGLTVVRELMRPSSRMSR